MAIEQSRKAQLIAELDRARSRASANRQAMRGTGKKVSHQAQASVARNRYAWVVGAVVTGFVIAKIPPRTKKVVVRRGGGESKNAQMEMAGKAGFGLAIAKIALDVAKPVIMAWATKRLGEAVAVGKDVRRKVDRVDRKT